MIARLVAFSTRHPRLVIAAALLLALAGELARRAASRDVLPELADPHVPLVVDWMGHPAAQVDERVTQVLTSALAGIPGSVAVRGQSMSGMAYVDVVFAGTGALSRGRSEIAARVEGLRATLPSTARLQVGPDSPSTGWVFQYALIDPTHGQTPRTLRRLQDEVLRPKLAAIAGVAEVASVGGGLDEVVIDVSSEELRKRALAFSDVVAALPDRLPQGVEALQGVPVHGSGTGAGVSLREVAYVHVVHGMPEGVADLGGFPAVGGIVVARRDADVPALLSSVQRALDEQRGSLPAGVKLLTVYDRSDLIGRIQRALLHTLGQEVAVVALVILVFLLHGRSALVPLATLPVVVLLTFAAMWILRIPATVMSLAGIGIALGMAVDADVIALEACHRRLAGAGADLSREDRRARVLAAAGSLAPAILVSLLIAAVSFLPVLAFSGETGRLLRPLAITKTLVIGAAALVSLTLAPALRDRLLRGRMIPEFHNPLTSRLVRLYRPFVHFALARPALTLLVAALALISCVPVALRLGGEFLPRMDEGDLLFMPTTLSGAPIEELGTQLRLQDTALRQAPEVATVFGKVGRADSASDPAPYTMAETTIRLRPHDEWPKVARSRWYSGWAPPFARSLLSRLWPEERALTVAELVERLDRSARLPGWTSAWTTPARARMDMTTTGIRTPVGIRAVAADARRLAALGTALRNLALRLPGTRSAVFESLGAETRLAYALDPAALSAFRVDPELARRAIDLLIGGGQIGDLEIAGRRVRVRIAQDQNQRGAADQLREITIRSSGERSQPVPLALLGHPTWVDEPAMLRNEAGERVAYVHVDLADGTDPQAYVERARRAVDAAIGSGELKLAPGERVEWAGQYELLVAGARRLRLIVPLVLLSMLALLYLQFRSLSEALIVLLSVPFALVGSFWTLYWLGYPLSAPVWVGLLAVAGLAMQTGVVMVVYIDEAFYRRLASGRLHSREDIVAAHAEGTIRRLRPKIMTITTMGAGLLPLLWAGGAGASIMKRVAAPMVGGLLTSALLTLEVLPVVYTIWRSRQLERARRRGVAIDTLVGAVPAWALAAPRTLQ